MVARARFLISCLALAVGIAGLYPSSATANEPPEAAPPTSGGHKDGEHSLIEVAPELYYTAKRYSKFYGDANTTHGNILERSDLLGNVGGARDYLADHGLYIDLGVTQFLQSNVSGGERSPSGPRYSGSTDLWMWFDTGKSELWPGGALFMHGEGRWNRRINGDVGSLLPANFDTTMPDGDPDSSNWALSEWYFMQGLPANLLAAAGKIDMAAWADTKKKPNGRCPSRGQGIHPSPHCVGPLGRSLLALATPALAGSRVAHAQPMSKTKDKHRTPLRRSADGLDAFEDLRCDPFRRLQQETILQMGVALGGGDVAMAEQLAGHHQRLALHHGLRGEGMAQIV